MKGMIAVALATALAASVTEAQCSGTCEGDLNGNGQVTVNELVRAVNNLLCDCCNAAPTATPTMTNTATPLPTDTATSTPVPTSTPTERPAILPLVSGMDVTSEDINPAGDTDTFTFTLEQPMNVIAVASTLAGSVELCLEIRPTAPGGKVCEVSLPPARVDVELPAGTYFLIVSGTPPAMFPYTLSYLELPPKVPVCDLCPCP